MNNHPKGIICINNKLLNALNFKMEQLFDALTVSC